MTTLRSAVRGLVRDPLFNLVAVACLSVGVGANITLFAVVDAMLFRPPVGVGDPDRVVRIRVGAGSGPVASGAGPTANYPQYEAIVAERVARPFEGVSAYGSRQATVGSGLEAQPIEVGVVTGNFFSVMGVRPALGRFFDTDEGAVGSGAPVLVLSDDGWERFFGRAHNVLGRSLVLDGVSVRVIGVAPDGFLGADLRRTDGWISMGLTALPEFGGAGLRGPGHFWLQFVGRLAEGVTLEQARAVVTPARAGDPFVAEPVTGSAVGGGGPTVPLTVLPLRTMFFGDTQGRSPVQPWLLGVSAALLLLACSTVANLLLARAVRARRDVAVRLALGASPGQIVSQHLTEAVVLAVPATLGAVALTAASAGLVELLPIPPLPKLINPRTLALSGEVAFVTPFVFGSLPALWAVRQDVNDVLSRGAGVGDRSVSRILGVLMASQTAIAFALLVMAGLFVMSLRNVRAVPSGFDLDGLLVAHVDVRYRSSGNGSDWADEAARRLRSLPGVSGVALGDVVPARWSSFGPLQIAGRGSDRGPSVNFDVVGPHWFEVTGVGIREGRGFREDEGPSSAPVAVVSRALAEAHWPTESPIGGCLEVGSFRAGCAEVVGVTEHVWYASPLGEPSQVVFLASRQAPGNREARVLFVRTAGDESAGVADVRAVVSQVAPSSPWVRVGTLAAEYRKRDFSWVVGAWVFGTIGALALLLAAVGLYMVVAFIAAGRRRELALRSALGAGRGRLLGVVAASAGKVWLVGALAGCALAVAAAGLLRRNLYCVSPLDPGAYAAVAGLLAVVTLLASLPTAVRASTTDPAGALRDE